MIRLLMKMTVMKMMIVNDFRLIFVFENFEQVLQTFAQSSKQKFADEPTTTRRPSGPNSKLRDLSKYEIVRAGSTKFKLLNNLKIPPWLANSPLCQMGCASYSVVPTFIRNLNICEYIALAVIQ